MPTAEPATRIAACEQAVRAEPQNIELRLTLGFALLDAGRTEAAASVMRSVLRQEPCSFPALVGLSKSARAANDTQNALLYATRAGIAAPGERGVQLDRAADLRALGRPAEAAAILRAILQTEPTHVAALMALGRIARESGEPAQAAEYFARAHAADPSAAPAAVALAEQKRALGETEAAALLLQQVLRADPTNLEALLSLSEAAWLAQDYELCLDLSQQAARAHPTHPAPPLQATRALMEQGRAAEALALLEPLGEAQAWPPELRARKGEILINDGAWACAAAVLEAPDPRPDAKPSFILWLQRVRLKLAVGDFETAESLLASPPARTPAEIPWIGLLRGQLAEARWRHQEARQHFASVLQGNPNGAWPHAELSRITLLLCDLDACRAHIGAALRLDAAAHKLRGQSLNPGNTHVGQIWDEFRMDRPRIARLRALLGQPAEDRLAPLLNMVREAPDHLPTAMMLCIALRQAGRLGVAPSPGAEPIPRAIMQYWDEATPPPEIDALMAGWRQANPDYTHTVFNLASAGRYLQAHYPPHTVRAYARCRLAAQKADIFRLAYLAREGGVYVDADDRCLAHLSSVLPEGADLVAWQEHFGTLGNNFLAASPGHPVLIRAADWAANAICRGDADIPWLATGPGLLTRAFAHVLSETPDLAHTCVLERFHVARVALFHQFAPYKRTKRHWLRAAFNAT